MTGQLDGDLTLLALLLSPVLAIGVAVSIPIRRRVPRRLVRAAVLTVCAASSLVLLVRSLV